MKREDTEPGRPTTPPGRPKKCPSCGSRSVGRITYGMPAMNRELDNDLASGRLVLGGCVVSGDEPDCHCNECSHEWRRKPSVTKEGRDFR